MKWSANDVRWLCDLIHSGAEGYGEDDARTQRKAIKCASWIHERAEVIARALSAVRTGPNEAMQADLLYAARQARKALARDGVTTFNALQPLNATLARFRCGHSACSQNFV